MNFAIRYLTDYRYCVPVSDNLNVLRVRPATTSTQRCDEFHVRVEPETRLGRHIDYFGTEVIEFGVSRPHQQLAIDVRARVVTAPPGEPPDGDWAETDTDAYRDAAGEFLLPAGEEPTNGAVDELAATIRARSPLAALLLACELIPDRFEYRPGVTYVGSTVGDLLDAGAGVCQDFVHLALLLLRRNGVAARYVSGYLFAAPGGGGADSVEVDTHAWVEALIPRERGLGEPVWVGVDPTNRGLAGEQHVKIGHGRHYRDVPPIKGVYRGPSDARAELSASVRMTRLDAATRARA
jgi:transglutaminase-like putative cysteine protease